MRNSFTLFFIFLSCYSVKAQSFYNSSFELTWDSVHNQPQHWQLMPGITAEKHLDSTTVHSGKYALKMMTSDPKSDVAGFHQVIKFNTDIPERIMIELWVKTINCSKGVGIECAQLDSSGKELSFTNSYLQESKLTGTNDWTNMKLVVFANPKVEQLDVTCYFNGDGTVWFDDASVEVAEKSNPTSQNVNAFIDSLIKFVQLKSIITDSVNWNMQTTNLRLYAKGMQTYEEARLLPPLVIEELRSHGDNHSLYLSAHKVKQFKTASIMGVGKKPEAKYLGNSIGYVSMPGFASMSDSIRNAFATETQGDIKALDTKENICSWVVDLREDNGGSAPPMLLGLGPILGNGVYATKTNKEETVQTLYEKGAIKEVKDKQQPVTLTMIPNAYELKNKNTPVAVLIGKHCGSSGESVALAFVGRKDTKSFGEPTAGFMKGNTDYTLPDSSMLFISSDVAYDRNGKIYADKIIPDILLDGNTGNANDVVLEKAKEWLMNIKKCK